MNEQFQSTLPRRERLHAMEVRAEYEDFNPRSREGSDSCTELLDGFPNNFNPRSREGSDIGA